MVERLAYSGQPSTKEVRILLGRKFRGLWKYGYVGDALLSLAKKVNEVEFWPEGWIAVRQVLNLNNEELDSRDKEQLCDLESTLRPKDLPQKIRATVFCSARHAYELDHLDGNDDLTSKLERAEALAHELGVAIAADGAYFDQMLPDIVRSEGRLWSFGRGLCKGAANPGFIWGHLVGAFCAMPEPRPYPQVLLGFLREFHSRDLASCEDVLDSTLKDSVLVSWYPSLQATFDIDERGVERLKSSLSLGRTPARAYSVLAAGRATDPIPAADLKEMLLRLITFDNGYDVAVEILHMRLDSEKQRTGAVAPELAEVGRLLLRIFRPSQWNDLQDYSMGVIAGHSLRGDEGAAVARELCEKLRDSASDYRIRPFQCDDLLYSVFSAQPHTALDTLLSGGDTELGTGAHLLRDSSWRTNPLNAVSTNVLLDCCERMPHVRYKLIASVITLVDRPTPAEPLCWTKTALKFLNRAPNPAEIVRAFVDQFTSHKGGRVGSVSAILQSYLPLLDELGLNSTYNAAVHEQRSRLLERISAVREFEIRINCDLGETFE